MVFKIYNIKIKYVDNKIFIHIFRFTGIRYNDIYFEIIINNNKFEYDKKYERYVKEYNIINLIKNKKEEYHQFNTWNITQTNLEFFDNKNNNDINYPKEYKCCFI